MRLTRPPRAARPPRRDTRPPVLVVRRSLGTPDETSWPGVSTLPDYKPVFPHWAARKDAYNRICPTLDPAGIDLLSKMLVYAPGRRISARDAMRCVAERRGSGLWSAAALPPLPRLQAPFL